MLCEWKGPARLECPCYSAQRDLEPAARLLDLQRERCRDLLGKKGFISLSPWSVK